MNPPSPRNQYNRNRKYIKTEQYQEDTQDKDLSNQENQQTKDIKQTMNYVPNKKLENYLRDRGVDHKWFNIYVALDDQFHKDSIMVVVAKSNVRKIQESLPKHFDGFRVCLETLRDPKFFYPWV